MRHRNIISDTMHTQWLCLIRSIKEKKPSNVIEHLQELHQSLLSSFAMTNLVLQSGYPKLSCSDLFLWLCAHATKKLLGLFGSIEHPKQMMDHCCNTVVLRKLLFLFERSQDLYNCTYENKYIEVATVFLHLIYRQIYIHTLDDMLL